MARQKNVFDKVAELGESAALRMAEQMMESPALMNALARTMSAKSKLDDAQQVAMQAFNLPTTREIEKLKTSVRSLNRRVDMLERQLEEQQRAGGASTQGRPRGGRNTARKGASRAGKKPPPAAGSGS